MPPEPSPVLAPPLGTVLSSGHELRRLLGGSGLTRVYEATGAGDERVAVKLLLVDAGQLTEGQAFIKRFRREMRLAASLDEPHLVPALHTEMDEQLGLIYFVMPLLSGFDLQQLLSQVCPLPPAVAIGLMLQACAGIEASHDIGVVHRGIKPANLFLEHGSEGKITVRILDFGIAKWLHNNAELTATGTLVGPSHYSSPEQAAEAKQVDERSDVWSLGAVLYHMLSGQPPYGEQQQPTELRIAMHTRAVAPIQDPAPWLDPGLAVVIHGALLRDVDHRCPSVSEFAKALEPFAPINEELRPHDLNPLSEAQRTERPRAELPARWLPVAASSRPSPFSSPAPDPRIGQTLGERYTLIRCLGRGGMGAVYEAKGDRGERYAIKVLRPDLQSRSSRSRRRFVREAKVAATVHHDNVAQVIEADTDPHQHTPYIVMELLQGRDLDELLKKQGPLPPQVAVRLFIQACRGVGAAHELQLVHRDIKPSNLFLARQPAGEVVVKVCDFGIVRQVDIDDAATTATKLTGTGALVGSPRYLSPEQARDPHLVDHRTDIWSLGVSLFEALSGKAPFKGDTVGKLVLAICTDAAPNLQDFAPWIAPRLAAVVHQSLSRVADERFQTVEQLAEALAPFAGDDTRVTERMLVPVSEKERSQSAERAELAPTETNATEVTAARTHQPAARSGRARLPLAAVAVVIALGAVVSVWRLTGTSGQAEITNEALPSALAKSSTYGSAQLAGSTSADRSAQKLEAIVPVLPATASVTVDGREHPLINGLLRFHGHPGQKVRIVVRDGSDEFAGSYVILEDGALATEDGLPLTVPLQIAGRPSPMAKPAKPGVTTRPLGATTATKTTTTLPSAAPSTKSSALTFDDYDYPKPTKPQPKP